MIQKMIRIGSILVFCAAASTLCFAQDAPSDIDPGLAKQIARDKQLLEIWKDHVRTLTRERDEAYRRIEELKSAQAAELPPAQDTQALDAARRDKETALREAEALRAQVSTLETQIAKLQVQGAHRQFAVETRPDGGAQNPGSQKFYANLTKNYMLQQESIKKLKAELARVESEKSAASEEQIFQFQSENQSLENSYQEALGRVRSLESELAASKKTTRELSDASKNLETVLAQVNSEKSRLAADLESAKSLEGEVARLESEKEALEKDTRQSLDEIGELESQQSFLKQEITRLGTENQEIQKSYDTAILEIDGFKSRAQNTEAELQKTNANNRALQELIEKLKAEASQLRDQKASADQVIQDLNARLETETFRSKELDAALKNALARADESARRAQEIQEDLTAQNDALKEKLNSNATDVKNLKENFETMLEPLVSSFDDRKKVV